MNRFKKNFSTFYVKLLHFLLLFGNLIFLSSQAHANGLQKAKTVLETIKTEMLSIVPIVAVIALIGLGIGYALNFVQKETFMRWGAGLIVVGSAAQITSMLLN